MRKLLFLIAAASFTLLLARTARAQDTIEAFGGYSYVRPSLTVTETVLCPGVGCPIVQTITAHPNTNGWEVSGVYNAYHWLGVAADFGGYYGSVNGASTHVNSYLFGPQIQLHERVAPFAHALIGVAHETVGSGSSGAFVVSPGSSNAFAAAFGAGIDLQAAPFLSVRAIQLDYLVTRFGSSTQNQPRVSAGLVLHF
jgi:hypothetical protein